MMQQLRVHMTFVCAIVDTLQELVDSNNKPTFQ